jgi:hypothetical protein
MVDRASAIARSSMPRALVTTRVSVMGARARVVAQAPIREESSAVERCRRSSSALTSESISGARLVIHIHTRKTR